MDIAAAAAKWADTWARAWPAADTEAVAALYTPDALFFSHPFRAHETPAAYAAWAFADQAAAVCRFGAPIASGERAAVDWWSVVTDRAGAEETLAGTSLLRFGADGLVVEQRDVWAAEEGRHELPHWTS